MHWGMVVPKFEVAISRLHRNHMKDAIPMGTGSAPRRKKKNGMLYLSSGEAGGCTNKRQIGLRKVEAGIL